MASFLPSPDPGANITVTKEEFNLFHNIDRQLFTRLVVGLSRDTSQSTHVMAFIMWLEKKCKDFKMVANLLNWPDNLLNDLADEAVLALNCIERSQFPYSCDKVLPLIHNISRGTMTLQYFHENRIEIIPAVTKYLNDVCTRAFTDIVQQVHYERAMKQQNYNAANYYGTMQKAFMPPVMYYAPAPGVAIVPQQITVPVAQWHEGNSTPWVGSGTGADSYDAASRNDFNQEFKEILNKVQLSAATIASEMKEVPADDRTIFMTFSKGYPISESEVREFFARFLYYRLHSFTRKIIIYADISSYLDLLGLTSVCQIWFELFSLHVTPCGFDYDVVAHCD